MTKLSDLTHEQASGLRADIMQKIQEIDASADSKWSYGDRHIANHIETSLCEYILVLMANKHSPEKIVSELSDFLQADKVAGFVDWTLQRYNDVKSNTGAPMERRRVQTTEGRPGSRLFQSALRDVSASVTSPNEIKMDVDTEAAPAPAKARDGLSKDAAAARAARFGIPDADVPMRNRSPSPLYRALGDGDRRDRRRRQSPRRNDRRDRRSNRSQSPEFDARERGKSRRYRSISSRLNKALGDGDGDLQITDARELLNIRRQRRGEVTSQERLGDAESSIRVVRKIGEEEEAAPPAAKKVRCQYWPNCKASDCPYVHPTETCTYFPNCMFGDSCLYIHPAIPCKFQDKCQNPHCNYQHSSPANMPPIPQPRSGSFSTAVNPYMPPSAIQCRFFPNCKNPSCPFVHPSTEQCRFGAGCLRPSCPFAHPSERSLASRSKINAPCRYGKYCTKLDCPFQHLHSPTAMESAPQTPSSTPSTVPLAMDMAVDEPSNCGVIGDSVVIAPVTPTTIG